MNLRELSERLNLSQTTVSRALNGYPEVKAETRVRVQEAAAKYNYQPNQRARTLATGRSMSIGHIIPMSRQDEMVNVVFADFIAGAGLVYAKNGYNMSLSIVQDEDELTAYKRLGDSGSFDAVMVQSPTSDDPRIAYLSDLNIPFIVHGRATRVTSAYSWLDVNNKRAVATAVEHLIGLGHRDIGLINGEERMDFALRRREGYLQALRNAGIAPDKGLMRAGNMSEPNGYNAAIEMLERKRAPTAFFASSMLLALGIQRAVNQKGLRLGKDVSLVCFDDDISYLPNPGPEPLFTTMRSSVRAAGERCAELLIGKLNASCNAQPQELWEAELIIGTSSGPGPNA